MSDSQANHYQAGISDPQRPIAQSVKTLFDYQQQVNLLEQQNRWQDLERLCSEAIQLYPNLPRFYHLLGDAKLNLQRWAEAVVAYQSAIALDATFSWSHNNLGDALSQLQRWQEAVTAYQEAINLKDDFFWSYYNLGEALSQLNRWEEAVTAYRQAHVLAPENLEVAKKMVNYFPNEIEFYFTLSQVLARNNDLDQALVVCRMGLNIQPNHSSGLKLERAILSHR
ncbi:Tetratricopeptide TPR_1 repeat-containing protein [Halothece sp. PCC 7418]|uniref:tetratricopeptide repeat protein n=1 Tax=Halothece sp. (strain PCC 7418) TaxID=65093 RepID=UPI0002A0847E|nr:tetratricopeptide repeat protein [Halothece sp. PCC 7418]AFZ45412.1 Tetratricopeptide TPR_1 repeat-containing protein [Halothece sp. PCC 7418]